MLGILYFFKKVNEKTKERSGNIRFVKTTDYLDVSQDS